MKKRITIQYITIAITAIILTLVLTVVAFYKIFTGELVNDLENYANILSSTGVFDIEDDYSNVPEVSGLNIILIDADGNIRYDSAEENAGINNSEKEIEVGEAVKNGTGYSVHHSDTKGKNVFYYTKHLDNGMILLIEKESGSPAGILSNALPIIILVVIVMVVGCLVLAQFLTRSLIGPIEDMAEKLDDNSSVHVYRELTPFVTMIQKQHEDILKNAKMRQEFTANVSHELKTPLTAISGYAELIENGMAANEDVIRFAGEIHKSSKRLLTLINDIIRLSELDVMDQRIDKEEVDLYEIADNCVGMLQLKADRHKVSINLHGGHETIYADKEMMEELVYNLCDNAIRYNKTDGMVDVTISSYMDDEVKKVVLSVKDTGIGISKEHQERIFERFYRVDKSRSKSSGGTGLGLAIVKHIVAQHGIDMDLNSEEGRGTEIKVIF